MNYNAFTISKNDAITIKRQMTKSQLLDQVFNILNDDSIDNDDDDKLTVDITIVITEISI